METTARLDFPQQMVSLPEGGKKWVATVNSNGERERELKKDLLIADSTNQMHPK